MPSGLLPPLPCLLPVLCLSAGWFSTVLHAFSLLSLGGSSSCLFCRSFLPPGFCGSWGGVSPSVLLLLAPSVFCRCGFLVAVSALLHRFLSFSSSFFAGVFRSATMGVRALLLARFVGLLFSFLFLRCLCCVLSLPYAVRGRVLSALFPSVSLSGLLIFSLFGVVLPWASAASPCLWLLRVLSFGDGLLCVFFTVLFLMFS